MTKIPEDVMKAAYDAHLAALGRGACQAVKIITEAIMAERDRCAQAAKGAEADFQTRRLCLRGEQAYREFPGYSVNRIRDLYKSIASGVEGK